jgi:hypothetical protein
MTTKDEIRGWLECEQARGATHMLVVMDTFDREDYPVYVKPGENPRAVARGCSGDRVMECYAFHLDLEQQLHEHRANHYEMPTCTIHSDCRGCKELADACYQSRRP